MVTLAVDVDVGEVRSFMARASQRLRPALVKAVLRAAQFATGEIRRTLYSRDITSRGGLARSFRERLVAEGGDIVGAESYSDLVYARIQEEGGTILPRVRKTLAVPLSFAKVAPGKWPRHFPKEGPQALHLIPRPGKPPLLAQVRKNKKGETLSVKPIFVLVPKVTLKPQGYIAETARRIGDEVQTIVSEGVDEALEGDA